MTPKSKTRKTSKTAVSPRTKSTVKATAKAKPVKRTAKAATAPKKAVAKKAAETLPVTFSFFAPHAATVFVAGDFTGWQTAPISLAKEEGGNWKTTVALKPGEYQYRLLVDGEWQNDPSCPNVQPNEFGSANCVLSVAA